MILAFIMSDPMVDFLPGSVAGNAGAGDISGGEVDMEAV
jgi:hypothetical protein